MSEKIDIVRRLRLEANAMGEFSTYASREYSRLLLDSVEEIERLRAERDEARREICQLKGTVRWNHYFPHFDPKGYAKNRGWDCHKDYK
jgi:uncharacterized coiled-coil DUF342 family protein